MLICLKHPISLCYNAGQYVFMARIKLNNQRIFEKNINGWRMLEIEKSKGAEAIAKLAAQKVVSTEEIRREIQIAIDAGMANQDPNVQAYWKKMLHKGVKPTPEDVIVYIAKQVKKM